MNLFVKLHDSSDGSPIYIMYDAIILVRDDVVHINGTTIFVKETADEIMKLLDEVYQSL